MTVAVVCVACVCVAAMGWDAWRRWLVVAYARVEVDRAERDDSDALRDVDKRVERIERQLREAARVGR